MESPCDLGIETPGSKFNSPPVDDLTGCDQGSRVGGWVGASVGCGEKQDDFLLPAGLKYWQKGDMATFIVPPYVPCRVCSPNQSAYRVPGPYRCCFRAFDEGPRRRMI